MEWIRIPISSMVGVGGEFVQFLRVKDKLKPMKYYLDDPEKCDLPSESGELDILWALITSIDRSITTMFRFKPKSLQG